MPWWARVLEAFETECEEDNGLLVSGHGQGPRLTAGLWLNLLIEAVGDGLPQNQPLTLVTLAKLAPVGHRTEFNRVARRRNVDLIAALLALTVGRAKHDYLVTCCTRAVLRETRTGDLEKGPIGVHKVPGMGPRESLAGWALVPGNRAVRQVVGETLGPLLKDTVDDPERAQELRDEGVITYTPNHELPVEPSELLLEQLGRIAEAEAATRQYAGGTPSREASEAEPGPRAAEDLQRANWHRELPRLWDVIPYGFVRHAGAAGAERPSGSWHPGLDRAFLEELASRSPDGLWAAHAFGAAADLRDDPALERLSEAQPPFRSGSGFVEALLSDLAGKTEVARREGRGVPRLVRHPGVYVDGAVHDLLLYAGSLAAGTRQPEAWTIPCNLRYEQLERIGWCLRRHRDQPADGEETFEEAIRVLRERYRLTGSNGPQASSAPVRRLIRCVMLAANARRVAGLT